MNSLDKARYHKIISFDIFQTLVDVNKRIPDIWKSILENDYSEDKANLGAKTILQHYPSIYQKVVNCDTFTNMEDLYMECIRKALEDLPFYSDPKKILYHLIYQHSMAPFYEEASACIENISKSNDIILSSDSNHEMVDEIIKKVPCERVFISDDLCSYKEDSQGRFFKEVIEQLGICPSEMIHIGDSFADIIGANRAGITSCWLNRENRLWNDDRILPDYTIKNLEELNHIIYS